MSKFKVGDKVICNEHWAYGDKDDEGEVVAIGCGKPFDVSIRYINGKYSGMCLFCDEKYYSLIVEDEPKPKFEIGDKVRALKDLDTNSGWCTHIKKGDILTIEGYSARFTNFKTNKTSDIKADGRNVNSEDFELVTEEPKRKFKVGDIIIGNNEYRYGITKKGWIGKVTGVDYNSKEDIQVENIKGQPMCCVWVKSKYFDLYKEPTPKTVTEPVEVKPEEPIKIYSKYEQKAIDKIRKLFKEKK